MDEHRDRRPHRTPPGAGAAAPRTCEAVGCEQVTCPVWTSACPSSAAAAEPGAAPPGSDTQDFGALLARILRERGCTLRALAHVAGVTPGQVSNIIAGRRLPPRDGVEPWAALLGLQGAERERFLLAAQLAHCPPTVRALLRHGAPPSLELPAAQARPLPPRAQIVARIGRLERLLAGLSAELHELRREAGHDG